MERNTILIVDDQELNRVILRNVFENEYNILEAENGEQAMVLARQYREKIVAILLDLVMPIMDGYQVMEELDADHLLSELPVIVITAEDSAENEVKAFDLGASDIIMKPFEPHVVHRRVQNVVELTLRRLNQQELIEEQAAKIRESSAVMIDALSSIIEYRSMETGQHIHRIRLFTEVLLRDIVGCYPEYGLNEHKVEVIASASSMHDIGKIAIPDNILNKPGRLTNEEFEIMKQHTTKGCEMLAGLTRMGDMEYLQYAYNICRYHHERWDGRGYPDGLKGESIPICAQVVGIADCYDALTNDRVYKKAIPTGQAYNMILNGECGTFSPRLLESFKNVRQTFEQLTRDYADGREQPRPMTMDPKPLFLDDDDTMSVSEQKYFTLLQYTDATVVEVDFNNGFYHMVYLSSPDFELLKAGSSFSQSIQAFIAGAVHPSDQEALQNQTEDDIIQFFNDGRTRQSWRYRVYHQLTGSYRWCQVTLMRVSSENPKRRRAIFIWKPEDDTDIASMDLYTDAVSPSDDAGAVTKLKQYDMILDNLLGGVMVCKNDRWMTLVHINSGLTKLLGYTETEIQRLFQNHYLELVCPGDRKMLTDQLREQLCRGNSMETEYRLVAKDGHPVWVQDRGQLVTDSDGAEYFMCVLMDITRSREAQETLRQSLDWHRMILEKANDIIFEWDILKDELSYSGNWEEKFGYPPVGQNVSRQIQRISHVHPADIQVLSNLFTKMAMGVAYAECEFRIADITGRYRWCKARAGAQFDESGKAIKAVGVLMDIDEEKRTSAQLREEAQRDGLTRLYNKSISRKLIEEALAGDEDMPAAMMVIDMDNFKQINDNYGHMFGDAVLREFSEELSKLFRAGDIISRIGGDEFLVYMKDIPDGSVVEPRAAMIIEASHRTLQAKNVSCPVSCSIGISLYPEHGQTFEALFGCGDQALYHAKSRGKNTYSVYDADIMEHSLEMPEMEIIQLAACEAGRPEKQGESVCQS